MKKIDHLEYKWKELTTIERSIPSTSAFLYKYIFSLYKYLEKDEVTKLRKQIRSDILETRGFQKPSWYFLPFMPFYAALQICGYIINALKDLIRKLILSMFIVLSWIRPPKVPHKPSTTNPSAKEMPKSSLPSSMPESFSSKTSCRELNHIRQQANDRGYRSPLLTALSLGKESRRTALNKHGDLILLLFSDLIDDLLTCKNYPLEKS